MSATFDRDAARQVLDAIEPAVMEWHPDVLDALEACVRPAPAQIIDRDALAEAVSPQAFTLSGVRDIDGEWITRESIAFAYAAADRILALLRPVDGVVLTREEAAYARRWLPTKNSQRARDLADRLEAGS